MPAVTLQNSTVHSSQNCGVRIAFAAVTLPRVTSVRRCLLLRVPALGPPAVGGQPHGERAERHHREVDRRQAQEGGRDRVRRRRPERVEQRVGERRRDERAAAEAHDRQPGGQAGTVGEPLDQRRDGRDVADPEADAAEHAVAEVDEPELVERHAAGAHDEAERPEAARDEHRLARPAALHPGAAERGREPEHRDRDREDDRDRRELRVEVLDERLLEHAERVDLADREVHRERRGRDEPATVSRWRDRPVAIEQRQSHDAFLPCLGIPTGRRRTPAHRLPVGTMSEYGRDPAYRLALPRRAPRREHGAGRLGAGPRRGVPRRARIGRAAA